MLPPYLTVINGKCIHYHYYSISYGAIHFDVFFVTDTIRLRKGTLHNMLRVRQREPCLILVELCIIVMYNSRLRKGTYSLTQYGNS